MDNLRKHIVITGAAGTGKSTLLEALKIKGVLCTDEVSRKIIDREIVGGGDALPWRDTMKFVLNCIRETENNLRLLSHATVSDRSMLDHNVYLKLKNLRPPDALINFPYKEHYHSAVFYCPLWEEIYVQEAQRPESFECQVLVDELTRELYLKSGFDLIEIPKTCVAKRVEFFQDKLSSFSNDVIIQQINTKFVPVVSENFRD